MKRFEVVLCFKPFQHISKDKVLIIKCVDVLKHKTRFHYNARAQIFFSMEQTEQKTQEEVVIKLRLAEPQDLKEDRFTLRTGQPFWIRSMISGTFDNGPRILSAATNTLELAQWLSNKMIYVPVSSLDATTKTL